jgi:hypothetical protein
MHNARFETKMSNVNLKWIAVVLALVLAAVAFGASGAIAVLTRFFCTVSVSVFAIASTFGLVARMRA